MKICFTGPKIRVEAVKKIIDLFYNDIKPVYIVDDKDYYYDEFNARLEKIKNEIDAMIFTGELQYNIYNKIFFPEIPCDYIKKDWSSLQNAFLCFSKTGIDFTKVSIDSYSLSMVNHIFRDLNVSSEDIHIIERGKFEKTYSHNLFLKHKELFEKGRVVGCVSAMYTTYVELIDSGIPSVYAKPTTDIIVKTINNTRRKYFERMGNMGNIAILIVEITPKKEYSYIRKDEYLYMHEKIKVAEEIYYFAKDTNAAIVNESIDKFVILMNRKDFVEYTNNLQSFYLMNAIFSNTNCDVNIGIGYGFNPGEAKFNANLAIEKTNRDDKYLTYIVPNSETVIGPFDFLDKPKQEEKINVEDGHFYELSKRSGVSQSKIYELYTLIEKNKKNTDLKCTLNTNRQEI
jgi:hypothetical protein